MKRIGLFGGTFNPIHWGHLQSAAEVKHGFPMDRCYLTPTAVPPHKNDVRIADADARLEMIRLALNEYAEPLRLCAIELNRSGPSYTIDTVIQLQQRLSGDMRLYLILGIDAFLDIVSWRSYLALLQRLPFVIISRPDGSSTEPEPLAQRVASYLVENISSEYHFKADQACFEHPRLQSIYLHPVTAVAISSTLIRKRIREGRSIRHLVPEAVNRYIQSRGLYT